MNLWISLIYTNVQWKRTTYKSVKNMFLTEHFSLSIWYFSTVITCPNHGTFANLSDKWCSEDKATKTLTVKRKSQNLYSNAPDVKKFSITHPLAPRRCITSKHEEFDSQCASKTSTWNSWRHKQHFDHCTKTETLKRQSNVCSKIAIKSQMWAVLSRNLAHYIIKA